VGFAYIQYIEVWFSFPGKPAGAVPAHAAITPTPALQIMFVAGMQDQATAAGRTPGDRI
jgi:hypothetical protein